jgi:hypothetical protein
MPKNTAKPGTKAQRREEARKKAKQKKIIIISLCVLAVLAVSALVIYLVAGDSGTEIYSHGGQTVRLLEDGTFTATLAHGVRKSGEYVRVVNDEGIMMVTFVSGNEVGVGRIVNGALHIPESWDDGHGHGRILPGSP